MFKVILNWIINAKTFLLALLNLIYIVLVSFYELVFIVDSSCGMGVRDSSLNYSASQQNEGKHIPKACSAQSGYLKSRLY